MDTSGKMQLPCNWYFRGKKKEKHGENSSDASFAARRVSANSFVTINQHTSRILVTLQNTFARYNFYSRSGAAITRAIVRAAIIAGRFIHRNFVSCNVHYSRFQYAEVIGK